MNVLVIGGGGREHAIVWKLAQSPKVHHLYCAPGNAGMTGLAQQVPISVLDFPAIIEFCRQTAIDRVIVAPDDPLALGLVNELEEAGIRAFGPTRAAARIEASKVFAKTIMNEHHIPTADFRVFHALPDALAALADSKYPIVVKADGLAQGKGVLIAQNRAEAEHAVRLMMEDHAFGKAGGTILLETFLTGPELTVLAFTDGVTIKPMVTSRDHKRALDGDQGLNTGGMGAVSPGAVLSAKQMQEMQDTIFQPTIDALREAGCRFKGVIYFGLILTPDGPKVIEYNARFGDPEAQTVLPRLQTDLVDIMEAVLDDCLDGLPIHYSDDCSCCIVMASGGYPGAYQTGFPIEGLNQIQAGVLVFHAGTKYDELGRIVTAGGRVLGVTALAKTLPEAIDLAYAAVGMISFQDCHYRKDIGRT
jgi:phosphoribosylamine--glycine ligase